MKMSNITPTSVIPSVTAHAMSRGEMMAGLSWLSATSEDVAATLSGVGALASGTSAMDAIIANATEMNAKKNALNKARNELADKNPAAAVQLFTTMRKTAAPGTSVTRAVEGELLSAAVTAAKAKRDEEAARALLKQNDKRAAAAKAVDALSKAREALVKANRAEKTRLTAALDSVANTLEQQARYIEGVMQTQIARSGSSPRTDALRASAENLRTQAKKLRAESAVVAQAPVVPSNAPDEKRIADVANRFNIRTARWSKADRRRALISVLSDIADEPLAQVQDYEGALSYYGNDNIGRLMADIEFGNVQGAISGLAHCVHQMGYIDTTPVLAQADKVLAHGVKAAQRGYVEAVIPAYVGHTPALPAVQAQVAGLAGLGALGRAEWDTWCDRRASGEVKNDPAWAFYAAKGGVDACKRDGVFYSAPYSCKGLLEREVINWGDFAICAGKGVVDWVASGKAGEDVKKYTQTAQQTVTQVNQMTGQQPTQPSQTQPQQVNPTPPPATIPPRIIPAWVPPSVVATANNAYARGSSLLSDPKVLAVGAVVLVGVGYAVVSSMKKPVVS